jgi:hypothetical protein
MRQGILLLSILALADGTTFLPRDARKTREHRPSRVFLRRDALFLRRPAEQIGRGPAGYPQGKDVCVRVISHFCRNRNCGGELLGAAERILTDQTVRQVTENIDLCSYSQKVDLKALQRNKPRVREL